MLDRYGDTVYEKSQNKWWDGYCNERIVLLDDLDSLGGDKLGHYLKRWSDKWQCRAESKGSTVQLKHEWFIVTSNYSIDDIFGSPTGCTDPDYIIKRQLVQAIERRFRCFRAHDREGMEEVAREVH